MVNIIHSDCVAALKEMPDSSVDVIFIDPPYNTGNKEDKTIQYTKNERFAKKNWSPFHADWDTIENYEDWAVTWLFESSRVLKPKGSIFVCGSFHNIPDVANALGRANFYTIQWIAWCIPNSFPNLPMQKMVSANQTIIWARPDSKVGQFYDKEAARSYNAGKNLRDYWILPNATHVDKGKPWKKHPSKKPVGLVKRALDLTIPKSGFALETSLKHGPLHVVDFFAGSGTTGAACSMLAYEYPDIQLNCTLIDREELYVSWMHARFTENNEKITEEPTEEPTE